MNMQNTPSVPLPARWGDAVTMRRAGRTDRLRLLWEAAGILLASDDPDRMLQGLFRRIAPSLRIDTYFNFMVTEAGDALRLVSFAGIPEEAARAIARLEFGQAICGTVAVLGKPVVAVAIQQSDDPRVQLVRGFGIRAYACNPLLAGDELIGTLSFASRTRDRFGAEELGFFEAITRYVASAYERLRLIARLREQDRRKDEFLATLAHELRNPLAPIRTGVHLLTRDGLDEASRGRVLGMLERQTEQLVRLVDDLLDVGRITLGKIVLRAQRLDLAAVVREALETSHPLLSAGRHEVSVGLPAEPVSIRGDPVRLVQVVSNLLNNAAKYTPEGGRIGVSLEAGDGEVLIRVRDTGVGIPAEMLPRIFEMFAQADRSVARSQGGLGVGLALARRLVELHGGTVEAASDGPGRGSEFVVRLPRGADDPP